MFNFLEPRKVIRQLLQVDLCDLGSHYRVIVCNVGSWVYAAMLKFNYQSHHELQILIIPLLTVYHKVIYSRLFGCDFYIMSRSDIRYYWIQFL